MTNKSPATAGDAWKQAMRQEGEQQNKKAGVPMSIDAKRAIAMYVEGKSLQEVADELDCTAPGVRYVLRKNGIALRPRGGNNRGSVATGDQRVVGAGGRAKRGSEHHLAVLDDAKVAEARVLRLVGKLPWSKLVWWYGVPQTTLRKAVIGETWKHVPMPVVGGA